MEPYISFIIPLYNRPEEIKELLDSMAYMVAVPNVNWEVIVVEDGSAVTSKDIVSQYEDRLHVRYLWQENSGPAGARNKGAEYAMGEYFIFLDSDTILPPKYLTKVVEGLRSHPEVDLFGGPDRAMESFTPLQKAIDYSMTSIWTTGGIRGGKKKLDKFYPRTFNMGVSAKAFKTVKGFGNLRFGEDLDFSMNVLEAGFKSALFSEAWLYHKRRSSLKQFYKQVYNSGIARINLEKLHPGTLKIVHTFPSLFVVGHLVLILLSIFASPRWLSLIVVYMVLIAITATWHTKSLKVGLLSILTSYTQLMGYGIGFLHSWWKRIVMKEKNFTRFEKKFYN